MASDGDWPRVYPPAEDSHLLAETIVDLIGATDLVCDVGTGSGYVASRIRSESGATVVGIDLNPHACRAARDRGVQSVRGDLTEAVATGGVDVVVCNPPYLPTPADQEWDDWFGQALSGGETGRRVVARLLADVGRVLAPGGRVYLLVSTLTDLPAVEALAADAGFRTTELADESYPFERLVVLGLTPAGTPALE